MLSLKFLKSRISLRTFFCTVTVLVILVKEHFSKLGNFKFCFATKNTVLQQYCQNVVFKTFFLHVKANKNVLLIGF